MVWKEKTITKDRLMDNLYYIPEIEEFYIGFEYEQELNNYEWRKMMRPQSDNFEWIKFEFNTSTSLSKIVKEIKEDKIRAKCLDTQDIKELGWNDNTIEIEDNEYKQYIRISLDKEYTKIEVSTHKKGVRYFVAPPYSIIFVGIIKNKSELKRLMKQLKILYHD